VWEDIPTHRVTTNWMYQLPFGRGRPWLRGANRALNLAVGGWEVSGIYSLHTGQFLTPFWSGPDPTGTAFSASRTPANVTRRPDHLRDANPPDAQRSVNRWFDAGAFTGPQAGRTAPRPRASSRDRASTCGTSGSSRISSWPRGRPGIRWELTATNFFNHPNWSNPATNITSLAQVGVISGVGGVNGASTGDQPGARSFRMGLRLEW